jgi:hypothetical protein
MSEDFPVELEGFTVPVEIEGFTVPVEIEDFPVEILYSIFNHLNYREKHQLQRVCKSWKYILEDMILNESPFDIIKSLNFHIAIDPNHRGHNEYAWFIKEITSCENLCMKVGWKILELDMLYQEEEDEDEFTTQPKQPFTKAQISQKALECVVEDKMTYRLLSTLRTRYINYCLEKFEKLYKIKLTAEQIGIDQACIPILLIMGGSHPKDLFVEFTINDTETFHPHDYKMSCEFDEETDTAKWSGLGDYWESMEILDILKLFWDETKSAYNFTHSNIDTSSVSYIFEFIVYAINK